VPSPTQSVLSAACVVSDDEIYAVGSGRRLLAGSSRGWTEVLHGPSPMLGVAKFLGDVWVGASEAGLMKLAGDQLVPVKKMKAERLEARDELLVSSPGGIASTRDGDKLSGAATTRVLAMLENEAPRWVATHR
jgi:hypothetical protein